MFSDQTSCVVAFHKATESFAFIPLLNASDEWFPFRSVIIGRAENSVFPAEPPHMIQAAMPARHEHRFGPSKLFPRRSSPPPPLSRGNSVRGVAICKHLSGDMGLHMMDVAQISLATVRTTVATIVAGNDKEADQHNPNLELQPSRRHL